MNKCEYSLYGISTDICVYEWTQKELRFLNKSLEEFNREIDKDINNPEQSREAIERYKELRDSHGKDLRERIKKNTVTPCNYCFIEKNK